MGIQYSNGCGRTERRLDGGGGFPLNGDLWKILRVEKIGKEIMRWLENFSMGRA